MREVFSSPPFGEVIITEYGVLCSFQVSDPTKSFVVIFPRDQIVKPVKIGLFGSVEFKTSSRVHVFPCSGKDKKRMQIALDTFNPLLGKPVSKELTFEDFGFEPPKPVEVIPDTKEYRMHCKVCGHVYCYTKGEYDANEKLKKQVASKESSAILSLLATSQAQASLDSQEAEMMKARIKDYSHCPKCNSADIEEIPEGEPIPNAPITDSKTSAMDELKKLKELLDMGIVTQEEFDAKKKQILGL